MSDHLLPKHLPTREQIEAGARILRGAVDVWSVLATNELLRVTRSVENQIDRNLGEYGLSLSRHSLLSVIIRAGAEGVSPTEAAEELSVSRPTMTGLIDGLERAGLVRRVRSNGADRRRVTLVATEKAVKLEMNMLPDHARRIALAMSKLSVRERKELIRLLALVEEGAAAYTDPDAVAAPPKRRRKTA